MAHGVKDGRRHFELSTARPEARVRRGEDASGTQCSVDFGVHRTYSGSQVIRHDTSLLSYPVDCNLDLKSIELPSRRWRQATGFQ
jgi:hypothetical protein